MTTLLIAATLLTAQPAPQAATYQPKGPKIVFTMERGGSFTLTTDPKSSPLTVAHILALVKKGFYDKQRIHRVQHWIAQWGSPASKSGPFFKVDKDGKPVIDTWTGKPAVVDAVGDGGSGKNIPKFEMCEVDFLRGVVGVASEGLQLPGDSQLFILKKDYQRLYHSYAVVGKITSGMDVVDKIKMGDRIKSAKVAK